MSTLIINMEEHKEFFASELGQAVLKEMAKSDSYEILDAIVGFEDTSKETIANIAKRLIATESSKLGDYDENNEDYIRVIASIAENKAADKNTLDEIYEFAMRLKGRYQTVTTYYKIAITMLERLAIHPNTSEETLHNIKANGGNSFVKLIVENPSISDEWLIEIVEHGISAVREAAIPELVRRLKAKLQQ